MNKSPLTFAKRLLLAFFIAVFSNGLSFGQDTVGNKYEWEKITLLESKRSEVETFLGEPISKDKNIVATYAKDFGKLTAWYVGAKEADGLICKWNVTEDTIHSFFVSLAEPIAISKFRYGLTGFTRNAEHDGSFVYTNPKLGISFVVWETENGQGSISAIVYSPTTDQIKGHCVVKK